MNKLQCLQFGDKLRIIAPSTGWQSSRLPVVLADRDFRHTRRLLALSIGGEVFMGTTSQPANTKLVKY